MVMQFTADSCRHCDEAKMAPCWYFTAGCRGCCARAAARSPEYHRAQAAGRVGGAYRRLLEQFGLTHEEVKAAHAADFEGAAKA